MKIEIEIPEEATLGDLMTVRGAIFDAAATFIDWERLHAASEFAEAAHDTISAPGRILMSFADQLRRMERVG